MKSLTKKVLTTSEVNEIMRNALNEEVKSFEPVMNGFYNSIYKVVLGSQTVYIKIAPSDDVDVLTYEFDILRKEAKLNELFFDIGIPVPKTIFADFTNDIIPNHYYIMSEVSGKALSEYEDASINKKPYYKELMKYLALLHNEKVDYFGYHNQHEFYESYGDTVFLMFDNLLNDAKRKNDLLPDFMVELVDKIKGYKELLDKVNKPSILHFDGWDGNIMIDEGKISAILDTERSFNGPRIADFVPLSFDIFSDENRYLIEEYNKYSDVKLELSYENNVLYNIHKTYLFLLMYVECKYRDVDGSFNQQREWSKGVLLELSKYFG